MGEINTQDLSTTVNEIKDKLHRGLCSFSYTKSDGTVRTAIGTLNSVYIESRGATPKGSKRNLPDDVVRYFDIERNAWRSFIIYDFIEFKED